MPTKRPTGPPPAATIARCHELLGELEATIGRLPVAGKNELDPPLNMVRALRGRLGVVVLRPDDDATPA